MSKISVIGAGAFGTALAHVFAQNPASDVTVWGRDAQVIRALANEHRNDRYLPGIALSPRLAATDELGALEGSDILLLAVPAQQTEALLEQIGNLAAPANLVFCAKGISLRDGLFQTQIADRILPDADKFVLTGPSFATDIAKGLPTALTLAGRHPERLTDLQNQLSTPRLRLYRCADPLGAQIGGAVKNVLAIACGMVIGAGLGESARAATLTRGFAEMTRLAGVLGADINTLYGLSGFGDLVLTASSQQSRNYTYGLALGRGEIPASEVTVEGVFTAKALVGLAKAHKVEMPISECVQNVIANPQDITAEIQSLLNRPLRME